MIWMELAVIGLAAGFLAGYLGIGGGLVVVPALAWLLGRDAATAQHAVHLAVGTSLSTMLVTSLSSILAHHRRGAIEWPTARQLLPGLLAGAAAGAFIADGLHSAALGGVFGIFAASVGLHMAAGRHPERQDRPASRAANAIASVVFGALSSLVGIGGGSLTVPWFMWHGMPARNAVATGAACGYPIAIAGTLGFVWFGLGNVSADGAWGYVYWPAFLGITAFSVLAAPVGAALVHRTPPALVRRLFGLFLVLVAVRMLWGWLS